MSHLTYMLLNIYYWIQCVILTHIWHINISPSSMKLFVSTIHHHEPFLLPKNVEADMISPLGLMGSQHLRESIYCRKSNHTSDNDVTSSSKILKLRYMNLFFTYLFLNLQYFIQCWDLIDICYTTIFYLLRMTKI